jgi:hypothetical protein
MPVQQRRHGLRKAEPNRSSRSEFHARFRGRDELRPSSRRKPAHARRGRQLLPGPRDRADGDRACLAQPPEHDSPPRPGQDAEPWAGDAGQSQLPDRLVEADAYRCARRHPQPALFDPRLRRLQLQPQVLRPSRDPTDPARTVEVDLDRDPCAGRQPPPRPDAAVPVEADRDRRSVRAPGRDADARGPEARPVHAREGRVVVHQRPARPGNVREGERRQHGRSQNQEHPRPASAAAVAAAA